MAEHTKPRTRRAKARRAADEPAHPQVPPKGGRLRPLTLEDTARIVQCAFDILSRVGMADPPAELLTNALSSGADLNSDDRLCFPQAMVEDAIGRAPTSIDLPEYGGKSGLTIGGGGVHIGTGGAAVQILHTGAGEFQDSTLQDLFRLMQVLEACDNIHYGVRPVIARDLADTFELDINTAFACMKATRKPIGVSFSHPTHLEAAVTMFDTALGSEGMFRANPFCMGVVVHVVPPLRYAAEGCAVLNACIHQGMIPQICSAGQAGATSPVTLAGALAQGLAECFAGLMAVDLTSPGYPCIYALMPFISDLRTGAMSGGGGEAAIAGAAAAQLLKHAGLPSTVSAGMTDAKVTDAQAGYEKGYTVSLAAHAGADMINLSVGMLGSIMVASPEALVIDDDMCGAILRSVRGIELSDDTLDVEMIKRVVTGEGHYLGERTTLQRMKTDYVYPCLADRLAVQDWINAGRLTIWDRAEERVNEILAHADPRHLTRAAEDKIRQAFPIRLADQSL